MRVFMIGDRNDPGSVRDFKEKDLNRLKRLILYILFK